MQCAHDEGAKRVALQQPQNSMYTLWGMGEGITARGFAAERGVDFGLALLDYNCMKVCENRV